MDPLHAAVGVLGTKANPVEISDSEDDEKFREKVANKNKRLRDKKKVANKNKRLRRKKMKRCTEENQRIEEQENQRAEARRVAELKKQFEEGDFSCVISGEPMAYPVKTIDGHVYERQCIEKWFDTGRRTSPKTNLRLSSTELEPDDELQKRIQQYIETLPKAEQKPYWAAIKAKER